MKGDVEIKKYGALGCRQSQPILAQIVYGLRLAWFVFPIGDGVAVHQVWVSYSKFT